MLDTRSLSPLAMQAAAECGVSLVETRSKKPCILDKSFGLVRCLVGECSDKMAKEPSLKPKAPTAPKHNLMRLLSLAATQTMSRRENASHVPDCEATEMWISSGCRGHFICQGNQVTCGFSGLAYSTPRHHCTCAPLYKGGTYMAETGTPLLKLPEGLRDAPRLVEARQGMPRYVPRSVNESLAATFTLWNLLDASMHKIAAEQNYQTGYVRELQVRRMVALAQHPSARTYCEIGFNGGHSAAAMLLANPRLMVHSFDLMAWGYSEQAVSLLQLQFGERFKMHRGDSRATVPAWARSNARSCDLLFIDGDHEKEGARLDMLNMRPAAAPGAYAIADDINSSPGRALEDLAAARVLDIVESYGPYEAPSPHNPCMRTAKRGPYCGTWGFAVYRYRGLRSQRRVANDSSAAPALGRPHARTAGGQLRHGSGAVKTSSRMAGSGLHGESE